MRIVTVATLVSLFALGCSSQTSSPSADAHLSTVDTVPSISKPQDTLSPVPTGGTCPNTVDYFSATACNTLENSAPAIPYTATPVRHPPFPEAPSSMANTTQARSKGLVPPLELAAKSPSSLPKMRPSFTGRETCLMQPKILPSAR